MADTQQPDISQYNDILDSVLGSKQAKTPAAPDISAYSDILDDVLKAKPAAPATPEQPAVSFKPSKLTPFDPHPPRHPDVAPDPKDFGLTVPNHKPGEELPEDEPGDSAPYWDTPQQRAGAERYNQALYAWRRSQGLPGEYEAPGASPVSFPPSKLTPYDRQANAAVPPASVPTPASPFQAFQNLEGATPPVPPAAPAPKPSPFPGQPVIGPAAPAQPAAPGVPGVPGGVPPGPHPPALPAE